MNPLDTLQMLQDWINELDRRVAVSYIKSNSDLLDTNLEEFIRNCPHSCKLHVEEMLLKAGIELPNMSLKQYDKLLSGYVTACKIDYQKSFEDYIANTCKWITIDTIPEVEETL